MKKYFLTVLMGLFLATSFLAVSPNKSFAVGAKTKKVTIIKKKKITHKAGKATVIHHHKKKTGTNKVGPKKGK